MRTFFTATLTAMALSMIAPLCVAQGPSATVENGPVKAPKKPVSFDLSAIDKSANPCTDFYQYACGGWMKDNPIPPDQVRWGRFNELAEYNDYLLYKELKAAASTPRTALQKQYGDFYAACMNTREVDQLGARPLDPEMDAIAALKSTEDLAAFNAQQIRRGGGGFFSIVVTQDQKNSSQQIAATRQGGLTLPDRDYYLNTGQRYVKIRSQYVDHMVKMFTLLGDTHDKAISEANNVMRIETALAKGSMSRVDMRDPANRYHMLSVAELQQLTPNYNWKTYLNGIGLPEVSQIDVVSPGYVKAVNEVLTTEPLQAIKSYLRWHALHAAAPLLSKPFEEENFAFFSQTLEGQKQEQPRWKRCTRLTDQALGEAVGQDWVKQHFPPNAKANTQKLVEALEASMAEDLKSLPWMSDATKAQALDKLHAIADKIGYPAHWKDYSSVVVKRDDLLSDEEHANWFERKRNLDKYGKPVDTSEWEMTPPTVNAYYEPSQNNINFPAGILQPPFYDNSLDAAVNFGGIGVVIGHEMTHAFDDEGAKYDLHGNVKGWWTAEDTARFKERTACMVKEYGGFEAVPGQTGQNLNGHLTLGENTADNGGLRIAYQALMETLAKQGAAAEPGYVDGKRDGYTPAQRFFISFGQVWCENRTEQYAGVAAKVDPHSPGRWRANGSVQNFPAFGKAFGCHAGQPMMPAGGGCRTW